MIHPVSSLNFKSTYVDNSYKNMNYSQQKTTGDIITKLQSSNGEEDTSIERYYEDQGKDFYITQGYNDDVELYIVKTQEGDVEEGSEILVGTYNQNKEFASKHVKRSLCMNKLANLLKFAFAAAIVILYVAGGVKMCKNNVQTKQLTEKVDSKIIGH